MKAQIHAMLALMELIFNPLPGAPSREHQRRPQPRERPHGSASESSHRAARLAKRGCPAAGFGFKFFDQHLTNDK
jgi:hypothetical protein